jgi:CHAT domain-containing protein/Tfp pilus assembly protein PilF
MYPRVCFVLLVMCFVAGWGLCDEPAKELTEKERKELEERAKEIYRIGNQLTQAGQLWESQKKFEESLAIRQTLYPASKYPQGHNDLAANLHSLAFVLGEQGKMVEAEPYYRAALAMKKKLYPVEKYPHGHPTIAATIHNLALLLKNRGKVGDAEELLREALAMDQKLYPSERFPNGHPNLASSLSSLGLVLYSQGRAAEAEPWFRDALTMRQKLYPPAQFPQGHSELAHSLANLGAVLQAQGKHVEAEKWHHRALAMAHQLYPPAKFPQGHPSLASDLNNLGHVLKAQGKAAEAEPWFREALTMNQKLYPPQRFPNGHSVVVTNLYNLGVVLHAQGKFTQAERSCRDALTMARKLYQPEQFPQGHPLVATCLHNLGSVLQSQGKLAEAEQQHRESLAMRENLFPPTRYPSGHPDLSSSLYKLGTTLLGQGKVAEAERCFRDSVTMNEKLYPEARYPQGHPSLAASLHALGFVLCDQGKAAEAERWLRASLAMNEKLYPEARYPQGHPDLVASLHALGAILHMQNKAAQARPHLSLALQNAIHYFLREATQMAETDAIQLRTEIEAKRDLYLSCTRNDAETTSYPLLGITKGTLVLLLTQKNRDTLASRNPHTQEHVIQLHNIRQQLSHLTEHPLTKVNEHRQKLRELSTRKEELEKDIARLLRMELPAWQGNLTSLKRLQTLLGSPTVFVDFYIYEEWRQNPQDLTRKGRRYTSRYLAFILTHDKPPQRIELGEAKPINETLQHWREEIIAGQESPATAEKLRKLLWEPLEKHFPKETKTVYLSPDGALWQLPWAALAGKQPGSVLLEDYALCLVQSGPDLLERLQRKAPQHTEPGRLLVVGGVQYDAKPATPVATEKEKVITRSANVDQPNVIWKPLPATKFEVERISTLGRKFNPIVLTGAEATHERVSAALPQVRYAHIATHGFFQKDDSKEKILALGPDAFLRSRTGERLGVFARNPLLLSGLVLAGANAEKRSGATTGTPLTPNPSPQRGEGSQKEPEYLGRGILLAEDLMGLRMDQLDLVVLSACETGLGTIETTEGVQGLARAFHVCGARTVIGSLWKVEDDSTAALMSVFYKYLWEDDLPKAEALRQAQLEVYRHPQMIQDWKNGKNLPAASKERGPDLANPKPRTPLPAGDATTGSKGKARIKQWAAFVLSGDAGIATKP